MALHTTVAISAAAAEAAAQAAVDEAAKNGWKVTVVIADAAGIPMLARRADGAMAASYEIACGKARTAALFAKETAVLEDASNVSDGKSRAALLSAGFVLMRGGLPLVIGGRCCGAVGVSGVKPDEDERVARAAVQVLASLPTAKL